MDLTSDYMGFKLKSPLMAGASPLVDDLDMVKRLEDAGSSVIVMHSLFEEQLVDEQLSAQDLIDAPAESFAEAITYFPNPKNYHLGPDDYLRQITRIKEAVSVPVIASLNGMTPGGWLRFAKQMEQAGADGLELNVYFLATDARESGSSIETQTVEMARTLKGQVTIPVAIKLSPFYTSFVHFAQQLAETGADALVIFNRFYQPDIDVEELEVLRKLRLSDSSELGLRLRWLAILSGRIHSSLAVTGGVHTALDTVKAIMSGAGAVQVVSAVLKNGPDFLRTLMQDLMQWMQAHGYESVRQMQGSMSLLRCPDPKAYERANYLHILKSWKV